MSAECTRCGWDLPYDGDCIACDENGTFKNQLVDAKAEATRLSNYEAAYNNLRLLTRSQYDDIDTLTDERDELQGVLTAAHQVIEERDTFIDAEIAKRAGAIDRWDKTFREMEELAGQILVERNEARKHWRACEEGWNKVIKQAEDFQRERDEAQETIDEMRAEGCAAAGVLGNIFNGVTAKGVNHDDPTIAKIASVAADALVSVPRCEHKEELASSQSSLRDRDRWLAAAVASSEGYKTRLEEEKGLTDTAIRAMEEAEWKLAMCSETLRDADEVKEAAQERLTSVMAALPAIIFGVVYYDLGEHGLTWKVCAERWEVHWKPSLLQEHSGDCTDECHSCARCQAEDVMRLVDIVRRGLDDGE